MTIFTIQIAIAVSLNLTQNVLDISIRGRSIFAPTWKMVIGVKSGKLSEEDYTHQYYEMMRRSYRQHREEWNKVLAMEKVVLACYCKADTFCHRLLLRDMLMKMGGSFAGEIKDAEDLASNLTQKGISLPPAFSKERQLLL